MALFFLEKGLISEFRTRGKIGFGDQADKIPDRNRNQTVADWSSVTGWKLVVWSIFSSGNSIVGGIYHVQSGAPQKWK